MQIECRCNILSIYQATWLCKNLKHKQYYMYNIKKGNYKSILHVFMRYFIKVLIKPMCSTAAFSFVLKCRIRKNCLSSWAHCKKTGKKIASQLDLFLQINSFCKKLHALPAVYHASGRLFCLKDKWQILNKSNIIICSVYCLLLNH